MEIRPASPADLDAIAGLYLHNHLSTYRELLPDYVSGLSLPYCREKWAAFLNGPENRVWAAFEGGAFLGFAACAPDAELSETLYLEALHVAESARGKGVGTALIRSAAGYAAAHGCRSMSVCIIRGNERAGRLYRKLGAAHFKYFEDDFHGTRTRSEKLLWETLPEGKEKGEEMHV
ncbi:MAG: GNAT family N-acetyltransferase [Eubacteriales bacterium]|nr:GNAT family N-acetyltransferase [Eubacteriales bacterium]